MASGWNLWVQLECIGVVSECCCKEYFSLYTPLVLALFWQHHPYFFVHYLMFFHSCLCYFCAML